MKVTIPNGIEPKHLAAIRDIMGCILNDDLQPKFDVKQINLRLHKSRSDDRLPYFIDWVGVDDVMKILKRDETDIDPGLFRFGDSVPSKVNQEAVDGAPNIIIDRDWTQPQSLNEKRPESRLLAQKVNVMYQKVLGIIAFDDEKKQNRCVGTFTAGFLRAPGNADDVNKELKQIAGWTGGQSELVRWIQDNLVLGGPAKK